MSPTTRFALRPRISPASVADAPLETGEETCGVPYGLLFIEAEAVGLHHAGIRFERLNFHSRLRDRREHPSRHRRSYDDADVGTLRADFPYQLDLP